VVNDYSFTCDVVHLQHVSAYSIMYDNSGNVPITIHLNKLKDMIQTRLNNLKKTMGDT